jgi:hypothetical protein
MAYAVKEPLGHEAFEEPSEGASRDGWVLITAGQLCIGCAALPAALIYQSFRDGTNFWLWFALALVVIGGVLAGIGHLLQDRGERPASERLDRLICRHPASLRLAVFARCR